MERLLGFDLQLLQDSFITGINIFILFFALSYLLFNPVRSHLDKRREKIARQLSEAAGNKEAARALREKYEAKVKDINKEADRILDDARKKAKVRETEIIREAKDEAARILDRTGRDIQLEKRRALDEMKQEVITIASAMAGRVVAASINSNIQNTLFEETLREIGESTWQS